MNTKIINIACYLNSASNHVKLRWVCLAYYLYWGRTRLESLFIQSKTTLLQIVLGNNANRLKRLRSKKDTVFTLSLVFIFSFSIILACPVWPPLTYCFKGMKIFQFCLYCLFFRKVIALLSSLMLSSTLPFIMAMLSGLSSHHFALCVFFPYLCI